MYHVGFALVCHVGGFDSYQPLDSATIVGAFSVKVATIESALIVILRRTEIVGDEMENEALCTLCKCLALAEGVGACRLNCAVSKSSVMLTFLTAETVGGTTDIVPVITWAVWLLLPDKLGATCEKVAGMTVGVTVGLAVTEIEGATTLDVNETVETCTVTFPPAATDGVSELNVPVTGETLITLSCAMLGEITLNVEVRDEIVGEALAVMVGATTERTPPITAVEIL